MLTIIFNAKYLAVHDPRQVSSYEYSSDIGCEFLSRGPESHLYEVRSILEIQAFNR